MAGMGRADVRRHGVWRARRLVRGSGRWMVVLDPRQVRDRATPGASDHEAELGSGKMARPRPDRQSAAALQHILAVGDDRRRGCDGRLCRVHEHRLVRKPRALRARQYFDAESGLGLERRRSGGVAPADRSRRPVAWSSDGLVLRGRLVRWRGRDAVSLSRQGIRGAGSHRLDPGVCDFGRRDRLARWQCPGSYGAAAGDCRRRRGRIDCHRGLGLVADASVRLGGGRLWIAGRQCRRERRTLASVSGAGAAGQRRGTRTSAASSLSGAN